MQQQWEYASLEWLWEANSIRCNLPDGREEILSGSYTELVAILNDLGKNRWEVATCVAGANWIFWTLKRSH
ncbi:hypothetical protein [Eisenibacter elegans]|jgi:hypothetical protein|uniref:hypothetical protein n=1 Tax=Eisenibacter elegans TaxID=997 RepID=UPI0004028258|nr:hypothetical protein [Eisenibacter elegans]